MAFNSIGFPLPQLGDECSSLKVGEARSLASGNFYMPCSWLRWFFSCCLYSKMSLPLGQPRTVQGQQGRLLYTCPSPCTSLNQPRWWGRVVEGHSPGVGALSSCVGHYCFSAAANCHLTVCPLLRPGCQLMGSPKSGVAHRAAL